MSRENVEIVRQLQPAPGVDLTALFQRGDEEAAEASLAAASMWFAEDFTAIFHGLNDETRPGLAGLRDGWLDWLEPWDSYRVEIESIRDLGDRVLVFTCDFGRREGMPNEVEVKGGALWTVRQGKIARAEFFSERARALEAVGLSE